MTAQQRNTPATPVAQHPSVQYALNTDRNTVAQHNPLSPLPKGERGETNSSVAPLARPLSLADRDRFVGYLRLLDGLITGPELAHRLTRGLIVALENRG